MRLLAKQIQSFFYQKFTFSRAVRADANPRVLCLRHVVVFYAVFEESF